MASSQLLLSSGNYFPEMSLCLSLLRGVALLSQYLRQLTPGLESTWVVPAKGNVSLIHERLQQLLSFSETALPTDHFGKIAFHSQSVCMLRSQGAFAHFKHLTIGGLALCVPSHLGLQGCLVELGR